jgi:hypothetical protein
VDVSGEILPFPIHLEELTSYFHII